MAKEKTREIPVHTTEKSTPSDAKPELKKLVTLPGRHARSVMPGGCVAITCKSPSKRFNFCDEHYEQFKFGLIKKDGDPAQDYEKKFEQYQAYQEKQKFTKRVA